MSALFKWLAAKIQQYIEYPDLTGYISADELKKYATKTELSNISANFITEIDRCKEQFMPIGNYALATDIENFITAENLKDFATIEDLNNYPTKEDISRYLTDKIPTDYVTRKEMENFVLEEMVDVTSADYKKF